MAATHRRGLPGRNPNPFTKDEGRRLHYKGDSRYGPQTTKFPANHRPTHMAAFACCGLILLIIFVPWGTSPSSENVKSSRLQDFKLKQSSILPTLQPAAELGFKPKLKDDEPERNPNDRPDEEEDYESKLKDPPHVEEVEEEREKDKKEDSNEDLHANSEPPGMLDEEEHDPEVEEVAEGMDENETHEDASDESEEETGSNEGDEADEETGDKVGEGDEAEGETGEVTGDEEGEEAEEEEGDKVGEEAEEATGDKVGEDSEEVTVDELGDEDPEKTVDEAEEEEEGDKVGEVTKEATGDKGGDEADVGTVDEEGHEALEKTVDEAEEEGEDETNGQSDASVGKNDASTAAVDEDADEGGELAMSTDGENGILKNSTNATWIDSNSTMSGESEEEGVDKDNDLGLSADEADDVAAEAEDASATDKKSNMTGIAPAKEPSTGSFGDVIQHADEGGSVVSDGGNTTEPDLEEIGAENEQADEEQAGDEVGGIIGSDSDPVTFEPGNITNEDTSMPWSNFTTAMADENNLTSAMADEKDENSLDLDVTGAIHNASETSLHDGNFTESEPPGEDSEFSGSVSEAVDSSGNGTGIGDAAVVNPGEGDGLVEEDHATRSSNLGLETTMDYQANETSVTDMPEAFIDGIAVQNGTLFYNVTDETGEAAVVNTTDSDAYSFNETTDAHELGNGNDIDGSLLDAQTPKSPDEESGLLEEDSATRESRANETFEGDGSEMNEEETGAQSNNITISDATGLAVDSIDRTPAALDDLDTTNSTIRSTGVISMDSSNSSTLVDSIGASDEKTTPFESGSILRVDTVLDTVDTHESEPGVLRLNSEDIDGATTEAYEEAIPSVSLDTDEMKTSPTEGDVESSSDVSTEEGPSKSKRVYEVDTNLSAPDDVAGDNSTAVAEGTAEELRQENLLEDEESNENADSESVSRPNLRGASKDDVDARAN